MSTPDPIPARSSRANLDPLTAADVRVITLWQSAQRGDSGLTFSHVSEWLWGAAAVFPQHPIAHELRWLSLIASVRSRIEAAGFAPAAEPEAANTTALENDNAINLIRNAWEKAERRRVSWRFVSEWLDRCDRFAFSQAVISETRWLAMIAAQRATMEATK